jgi:ABC-2 type transport system permease protein
MIRSLVRSLRLYFVQARYSYLALFAWSVPFNYFASKFGFPFFTMLLFVFMGKFVGLKDPIYIVIGNILLMPAANGISGVSMTVGNERQFGALSYLLGSPAPRAPLFLGRALFHILDGFVTVAVALPVAILIFHLDLARINLPLALLCVLLIAFTTSGVGFVLGSITLVSRDGWMITSTLAVGLYLLVGVNFPVGLLPPFLRLIAFGLPMTRGLMAARLALVGAGWSAVAHLVYGELLVGIIYTALGYGLFRLLERRSMVNGTLDNL